MKKTILFMLACILSMQIFSQNFNETILLQEAEEQIEGGNFGHSISVDGNYAVVGVPAFAQSKGCAYIYYKNGNKWERQAKITSSDSENGDRFGNSVSISGNIIVVTSPGDDDNGNNSGSAYLFQKPTEGWKDTTETAKLLASDGEDRDYFGSSVSIYDEVIVIGAAFTADCSGCAYIFEKPEEGWKNMTETAKLTASDARTGNLFGGSVAIYKDVIVAGAVGCLMIGKKVPAVGSSGSAYVFKKPESGWATMTETAILTPGDGVDEDHFGRSVSIENNTIVVGSSYDDDNGSASGSAYLFEKPIVGWKDTTESAKLTASDGKEYDYFGCSVSISGDLIAIGSMGSLGKMGEEKQNVKQKSAVYLFKKPAEGWKAGTETAKLTASDGKVHDNFGFSVALSGDVLISGAPNKDGVHRNAGAVYVYTLGPEITLHPVNRELVDTDITITFEIKATSADTYQWQLSTDDGKTFTNLTNGDVYSGENTATLNVKTAMEQNNNQYRCIVINSWAKKISNSALLTIKSTTGIQHKENVNISVHPNPVKDILNINIGNNQFGIVEIYNLTGQKVKEKYCTENKEFMDLSLLKTGVYIIKIVAEKKTITYKIVKK